MLQQARNRDGVAPRGTLKLVKFSPWPAAVTLRVVLKHGLPRPGLPWEVFKWRVKNVPHLFRGARTLFWAKVHGIPTHYGALYLDKFTPQGRVAYGLASLRVVTSAGAGFLVDALQGTTEPENLKFHGFGTGTNAENASDTALQTELTTEYETNNTRPTGTQTENGSTVYRTVGSLDPDSAVAITEHGIFSDVDRGEGTLLDRSVFSSVSVAATGDSLQATYDFTITAGS